MLKQLRIDNFQCLDGFELELDGHALLLGLNGSGKSTVVEALARLRRFFVGGDKAGDCFPASTRTRWGSAHPQKFELELETGGEPLVLRVVLSAPDPDGRVLVEEEDLTGPGISIRRRRGSETPIDIGRGQLVARDLLLPDELSALPLLASRIAELPGIGRATHTAASFRPFRLDPASMETFAQKPSAVLHFDGGNFSSWLLSRTNPQLSPGRAAIEGRIAEVLPRFERFEFVPEGDRFRLVTLWRAATETSGTALRFDVGELSDGQRLIVVLCALVELSQRRELTLILDEPDNYVALQEIQPLLLTLMDLPNLQLIVISHHPGVIDLLAKDHGYVFSRADDVGPVRVKRWRAPSGTLLPASELVARGDIDGGA